MYRPLKILLVTERQNYPFLNRAMIILGVIFLVILIMLIFIKYDTYIVTYGKSNNDTLEVIIDSSYIEDVWKSHSLLIGNKEYSYRVKEISEIYTDSNYQMYQYVYLDIFKFDSINNYVYLVKIKKARKRLISYLIQDMF